jgi:hypothetical protein
MYGEAPSSLTKQPNGSISSVGPGDVVSINLYDAGSFVADGHVLIVNTTGTVTSGTVPLVSQNGGDSSNAIVQSSATLSNGTLTIPNSGAWSYSVIGVVHAPNGGAAPPPPTLLPDSSPGMVVDQHTGLTNLVVDGPNNTLDSYFVTPGQPWNGPTLVGGTDSTYSAPAAVQDQSTGLITVVVEGPNNTLDSYFVTPGQPWNGPTLVGGTDSTYSAPAAVQDQSTGLITVVVEGPNNTLDNYFVTPGQPWNGPTLVGGTDSTYSAPAAVQDQSTGLITVVVEGPNNTLDNYFVTPGQPWSGATLVGGTDGDFTSPQVAVNPASGLLTVFVVGGNDSPDSYFTTPGEPWNGPTLIGPLQGTPPAFVSSPTLTFSTGSNLSFDVVSRGFPTPTLSESGTLPSGISFVDQGDGTATIEGEVAVGASSSYSVVITASNGVSPNAVQSLNLMQQVAPAFTSRSSATFIAGNPSSFTAVATGYPTPTLAETGALPSGVTFTGGVLSGAATTSGTFPITITASNGVSPDATQSFTLSVVPLGITTTSLPNGTAKTPYTATLAASGGNPPYQWKLAAGSKLPKGLKLSSSGQITGTPMAAGKTTVGIQVTDTKTKTKPPAQHVATATFTITVS